MLSNTHVCPVCGKSFMIHVPFAQYMYKHGDRYYCSYSCYHSDGNDSGLYGKGKRQGTSWEPKKRTPGEGQWQSQ